MIYDILNKILIYMFFGIQIIGAIGLMIITLDGSNFEHQEEDE